jgi:predicted GNAT family N-acyltransferase
MTTEVTRASAAELERCFEIRRIVFVDEQGVSREDEFDDLDAHCVHFIAHLDERAVGTARLLVSGDTAKAQRVAVLADARRHRIGAKLMAALESEAGARGLTGIVLHAQTVAIPFYEAIGYDAEGPVFLEADIPHRLMRKRISPA